MNFNGVFLVNRSLLPTFPILPFVTPKKPSGQETLASRNHRAKKITTKMVSQTFGGALDRPH